MKPSRSSMEIAEELVRVYAENVNSESGGDPERVLVDMIARAIDEAREDAQRPVTSET